MQQNGSSPMRADVTNCWKRVLSSSQPVQEGTPTVKGYDFNQGVDYNKIFQQFADVGFQASHLGRAINTMNSMFDCRFQPIPPEIAATKGTHISEGRPLTNCTIFMGYTSNMVSAGTRDIIRYLVQHNMVDCIVSTAGGIEEDFMKCLDTFYLGDFSLKGSELHRKNHNRTGNLIVPNNCYRSFHEFINPILEEMMEEQKSGAEFTPSKLVWRLGRAINHPDSIYYWAYKNKIPVFSPAITDGAIGDNLFYHRHAHPGCALKLDIVEDIQAVNDMALGSIHTGLLIIGGGLIKHHILNANTFHTGGDFSVYINTAAEFDGSDAGATPEEAVSWGKIAVLGRRIKVFADATLVLPILVGETFAKREKEFEEFNKKHLLDKPSGSEPSDSTPAGI